MYLLSIFFVLVFEVIGNKKLMVFVFRGFRFGGMVR